MVTKESLGESNTHYAQGGIAVAEPDEENIALHLEDTVAAGDGLVYRPAAQTLVREGPSASPSSSSGARALMRKTGAFCAHAKPRTRARASFTPMATPPARRSAVHLSRWPARIGAIQFAEWTTVTGLLVDDGRVIGADLLDRE